MRTLANKRRTVLVGLLLVAALAISACGGATTVAPEPDTAPTEEPVAETTEAPAGDGGQATTPAVSVSDQTLEEGTVTVDSVTAAEAGWVVIHADQDGAPGPVIGQAAVEVGVSEDVSIEIDGDAATSTLYAMLHLDTGAAGEYEFPEADPPVRVDDQIVLAPFQLDMGATMETSGTTVASADTELGTILVGPEGLTLYLLTADSPDESTCTGGCAAAWPPLTTEGEPQAGENVEASLLGTLTRSDGSSQVTYNGWPLYHFADDNSPGDTNGQGLQGQGGTWYLIGADGAPIEGDGSADDGAGGAAGEGEDVDDLY